MTELRKSVNICQCLKQKERFWHTAYNEHLCMTLNREHSSLNDYEYIQTGYIQATPLAPSLTFSINVLAVSNKHISKNFYNLIHQNAIKISKTLKIIHQLCQYLRCWTLQVSIQFWIRQRQNVIITKVIKILVNRRVRISLGSIVFTRVPHVEVPHFDNCLPCFSAVLSVMAYHTTHCL